MVSRDIAVERVTGIEPAQSAWKAWSSERCLSWSRARRAAFVPSGCLSIGLDFGTTAQAPSYVLHSVRHFSGGRDDYLPSR